MRLRSPWQPHLAEIKAPPWERLASALADDILEGKIEAGARLPPHRDIAYILGIGLGTVTRAFAVLALRGLVRSDKGRGTFVCPIAVRASPVIDLSINPPPSVLGEDLVARTLAAISRRSGMFSNSQPTVGGEEHRRQMARWLAGLGMETKADALLLCNGAQHAIWVAFLAASKPGGTILTETMTYSGAIRLARHAGYRLMAVEMDGEGILPNALEQALLAKADWAEPPILYVTPTMHNPTTATMSLSRRQEIVRVCRQWDVTIVEDDVYSFSASEDLSPIAMLAPERTFYASSMSKTLHPGLRMGVLVPPRRMFDRALIALGATSSMVSPLSCAVMERWLVDGSAGFVRGAIRSEAQRRRELAQSILGGAIRSTERDGFHIFLPMSRPEAERLDAAARSLGIAITSPHTVTVDPDMPHSGVRLCLGSPSLPDLTTALTGIANLLRDPNNRGLAA